MKKAIVLGMMCLVAVVAEAQTFVDLGLPSGLLWADRNVGASSPEDYGDYFAWGETSPKSTYNWSTYRLCNGNDDKLTRYCNYYNCGYNGYTDDMTILQPADDAATANWGGGARMPTREEWLELKDNITSKLMTVNGVEGKLFTSKKNGNSIFLPAAGCRWSDSLYYDGIYGDYLSSSLSTTETRRAWYFYFRTRSNYPGMITFFRSFGYSVRPVRASR